MAVTHLPEPHPTDPVVEQLLRIYQEAYDAILEELKRAVVAGLTTTHQVALLQELSRRVAELRAETLAWAYGPVDPATGRRQLSRSALYRAIAEADRETLRQLAAIGLRVEVPKRGMVSPSFSLLNDRAIRVVAENIVLSLDSAIEQFDRSVRGIIGRARNDLFRLEGLEAVGQKLAQGLTVRQARARLVNELTEQGIVAFVDSKGRAWNLKSYADMVVRTTTREATSEATLRRVEAEGHDYLIATEHRPTCPLCAARQGRVYCISGRDPRFPALATVGNTPWHPNCFTAGHLVTTEVGPVPIEEVQVGMYVLTHSNIFRPVTCTFRRDYAGEAIRIRVAGRTLTVTPEHPFLTRRGWVKAGDLRPDDELCILEDQA